MTSARARRRLLVPEVVQSSAMDCGPAALASVLGGFGIATNLAALREACRTDVDGTSIDAVEEIAAGRGLEAEQVMVPVDHLPLQEARALPAVVVVRRPSGALHFVVVWRRHGPFLQVMDPAVGRRWLRWAELEGEIYRHEHEVEAQAWREWAGSADHLAPLAARLRRLGIARAHAGRLVDEALADPGWRGLSRLDAAVRMAADGVEGGCLGRGGPAGRLLSHLLASGRPPEDIPERYWSVRPAAHPERLVLRGAVLVRVAGGPDRAAQEAGQAPGERAGPLASLLRRVVADSPWSVAGVALTVAVAAGLVLVEALAYRAVLEASHLLAPPVQRLGGLAAVLVLLAAAAALQPAVVSALLAAGRRLEAGLRLELLELLPRLDESFLRTRSTADLAERVHALHLLRHAPPLAGAGLEAAAQIAVTAGALAWLDPGGAAAAVATALAAVGIPIAVLPLMAEAELRVRSQASSVVELELELLRGLETVRLHAGEETVRREHAARLEGWCAASRRVVRIATLAEALHVGATVAGAVWLVLGHLARHGEGPGTLLLAYWALRLPVLAEHLGRVLRQASLVRGIAARALEPLGAPAAAEPAAVPRSGPTGEGVGLELAGVSVRLAGRTVLDRIDLAVAPGERVAVVGRSGAGKSTLVGLLIGRVRPSSGRLEADGRELEGEAVTALRRATAWVDPDVRLWNRSLLANLRYGLGHGAPAEVAGALAAVELEEVVSGLEHGLRTNLGEAGGRLSGSAGQRVRLARALLRDDVRLVVLDEALRGLDEALRQRVLGEMWRRWPHATAVVVTHEPGDALAFDRVAVIEDGRVAELGAPADLARDPHSRYRRLLDGAAAPELGGWRRLTLAGGRLVSGGAP